VVYEELPEDDPIFALTADPETVDEAETITIELENVSEEGQDTGNDEKYALEREVDGRWYDVRGYDPEDEHRLGHTDEAVPHGPGDGFTWEFSADADGFAEEE
jgi:hypothetical protein